MPQRRCKGGRIERRKSKRRAIRNKKPFGHGVGGKIGTAFSGGRSPVGSIHIGDFKDNDEGQGRFILVTLVNNVPYPSRIPLGPRIYQPLGQFSPP